MADARICDCCKKVFGDNEKISKPGYRLLIYDQSLYSEERRRAGMSAYKEPELCPKCVIKLTEIISKTDFGKI